MTVLMSRARAAVYLATLVAFVLVIVRAEMVDYSKYNHKYILHFGKFKYRFLTTWNFMLLSAHALLALVCECLAGPGEGKAPLLSALLKVRDVVFASMVFPMSVLVFTVFWGLYWVDRELIFPVFMDPVLPPFDNHMVHSTILPLVLLETLLQPRQVPRNHIPNMVFSTLFFIVYGIPFIGTYFVTGEFLYPFVQMMSAPTFVAFCLVLWAYTLALYLLQWPVVAWRWRHDFRLKVQ